MPFALPPDDTRVVMALELPITQLPMINQKMLDLAAFNPFAVERVLGYLEALEKLNSNLYLFPTNDPSTPPASTTSLNYRDRVKKIGDIEFFPNGASGATVESPLEVGIAQATKLKEAIARLLGIELVIQSTKNVIQPSGTISHRVNLYDF